MCPRAQECVLSAIQVELAYLNSNGGDDEAKLAAFEVPRTLGGGHPSTAYVSFEGDRGGNNIPVSGICGGNLHAAWDTCLVLTAAGEDPNEAAAGS